MLLVSQEQLIYLILISFWKPPVKRFEKKLLKSAGIAPENTENTIQNKDIWT